VKALAPYFNVGPFPVPGHANTVNKMQFRPDTYRVYHGPSMRMITDWSDLDGSLAVLPTGQSGLRASDHYADQTPLWLNGEYHPMRMERALIEAEATSKLVLRPPAVPPEED
jgi:penicillin amidase